MEFRAKNQLFFKFIVLFVIKEDEFLYQLPILLFLLFN